MTTTQPNRRRRPRRRASGIDDLDADTPRAPSALLLLLEGRAPMEYLAMLAAAPFLARLPRGDGHPVLVFPGMGANDWTTIPLRLFLRRLGYATYAWGQGTNRGPREGVLERCSETVRSLAEAHGRPVSLIGWSLGGIYAREMAKLHPEHVRSVITLGTPFTGHPRSTNAWRVYQWLTGLATDDPELRRQIRRAPPVPTTSIYSKTDGIVSWRCSLNPPSPSAENIEVRATHVGMGTNPLALFAIADRLRQPQGRWRKFDTSGARRWFYRGGGAEAVGAAA